jgi:hypothetical protein
MHRDGVPASHPSFWRPLRTATLKAAEPVCIGEGVDDGELQ